MSADDDAKAPVPLSRFRARLARPRGAARVDALLACDDAAGAVAALPVPEVYQLVQEVGFGDALELVALATPQQIRGCLDLDAWTDEHVDADAIVPWLRAIAEAGYEKVGEVWQGLDTELTALFLARVADIYDRTLEEEPPPEEERPIYQTPDTYFYVVLTSDREEDAKLVQHILEDLYRVDASGALARHTLMAARSEPLAELEEMSYRWRTGRMADLGYVELYEALEVFRPLDAERVAIGEGTEDRFGTPEESGDPDAAAAPRELPVPMAESVAGVAFLAAAVDQFAGDEGARLEAAMLVLVNKVLAAARVHPGDEEAMRVGAEHAFATLALGLETVARGDAERAADALRTISLTRLHRVGYTKTLRLAQVARALAPRAALAGEPDASLLAALCGARPFFPRELDDPPGTGPRPFATTEDLRRAAGALTALALRVALADSLGADLVGAAAEAEPPELDDFARTAMARAALGAGFSAAPLTRDELDGLRAHAAESGALDGEAIVRATKALYEHFARAGIGAGHDLLADMARHWIADVAETLRLPDPAMGNLRVR